MQTTFTHLRYFAHHHDDLPAFHAGYLVMTLLAAGLLNLGVFGMLILLHMTLDIVKYREFHGYSWRLTVRGMIKESLLDLTLLSVGLTFAVYLHHSVGVASLSGIMRAEVTVIRALGTIIPKMKILQHFLKVIAHVRHYLEFVHPKLHTEWEQSDKIHAFFFAFCCLLVLISPAVLGIDSSQFLAILADELIPWNF